MNMTKPIHGYYRNMDVTLYILKYMGIIGKYF